MRNKTIKQNTEAINDFFFDSENATKKNISELLFTLQGLFFAQPGIDFSDDYKNEILTQFNLLYSLVNSIQPVKK